MNIAQFYTKMKALWDELDNICPPQKCTCGKCTCDLAGRVSQETQDHMLLHFLMKVSEQYAHVRSTILMMTDLQVYWTYSGPALGFSGPGAKDYL